MTLPTSVFVLNVGAGSTTVVKSPSGNVSVIDLNDGQEQRSYETDPSAKPLTDPVAWCRDNVNGNIFRFILSHPDADHMAGLRRLLLKDGVSVVNFWDLPHKRTRSEEDCRTEKAWHDWALYHAFRSEVSIDGVTWPTRLSPMRGDTNNYWTGDQIEVLSPTPGLVATGDKADEYNDASYVLRVTHATTKVLIAGDVEETAWNDMIAAGVPLRANVLIASHHGRKSGFSEEAMALIKPEVVIVSTAKLPPEHDALADYERHAKRVFSTRTDGDIGMTLYDDGTLDVVDGEGTHLARLTDLPKSAG
jgi:beta-lactamase superfamily II metal-dependent hydrolase